MESAKWLLLLFLIVLALMGGAGIALGLDWLGAKFSERRKRNVARIFLTKRQWELLLELTSKELPGAYTIGERGQLWRLLIEANKHKRFVIEVENQD